jgi:glucan biosynthesis protein C
VAAIVATITLFSIGFLSLLKAIETAAPQIPPFGFGTWQSAVYALWDSVFAVGLCLAAITFFQRFFDGESRFGKFLSQHSYAVYVVHVPIVVLLAYALRGIQFAALLKFGLASLVGVPLCFAVAYVVRKMPFASRVF